MTASERAVQAHREATQAANQAIQKANSAALRALKAGYKARIASRASMRGVHYTHKTSAKTRVAIPGATPALRFRLEGQRDQAFLRSDRAMAEAEVAVQRTKQTRANVKRQRTLAGRTI